MTEMAVQKRFAQLLEAELNVRARKDPAYWRSLEGAKMEIPMTGVAKEVAESHGFPFASEIRHYGGRAFPDTSAGTFGLESKTSKDGWDVIGSSVNETTRIKGIEHVWLVFANLSGHIPQFKVRLYEDCLEDVQVTHYPRYFINAELAEGENVFARNGYEYDDVRMSDDPVRLALTLSEKTHNSEKWFGRGRDISSLSPAERNDVLVQTFVCCPEMFSNKRDKFSIASKFLYESGLFCSSVRDLYTAGGKASVTLSQGTVVVVPQIYAKLFALKDSIVQCLAAYKGGTANALMRAYIRQYCPEDKIDELGSYWKKAVLTQAATNKSYDMKAVTKLVNEII